VVPCFRCSFLLDMSSSTTPESPSAAYAQFLRRRHWPSTISHDFGTLDSPTIHFRWVHLFGLSVRLCYNLSSCLPLWWIRPGSRPADRDFYFRASDGLSPFPSPDMTTVATGQVPPRDFRPLEWQLASLHAKFGGPLHRPQRRLRQFPARRGAGRTLTRANPRSFAPSLWWQRRSRCNLSGVSIARTHSYWRWPWPRSAAASTRQVSPPTPRRLTLPAWVLGIPAGR